MAEPPYRVLIANRGEIAARIAAACHALGMEAIAVFSDPDRDALHVRVADEAVHIGPAPATESYLRGDRIVQAALEQRADAVHPGYGFLAESAEFAQQVIDAGLTWIGPPPAVIALMGDKIAAKAMAESAGIPVVPGYAGDDQSAERLRLEAERVGLPIMIKAAAGGGGRGMRVVRDWAELDPSIDAARREAGAAFGDERVFLERLIENPRHVEVQVFADTYGNAVYLGERDCSLQRRHQKVVEESPSPAVSEDIRQRIGADAVSLALESGYVGAGTVEYLFASGHHYFLEMNTRIQVEHPVTEAVTGVDLVQLQIEVARGRPLPFAQSDVVLRGHAIEARLYAEDADLGFLPATGTLETFRPPHGEGVRNDVGVYPGFAVSPYYDPMLAKLVVYEPTRGAAIEAMQRALARYRVTGLTTNLPFLRWLIAQPDFALGEVTTDFIDRVWPAASRGDIPSLALAAAAVWESLRDRQAEVAESAEGAWAALGPWRGVGASRTAHYTDGVHEYQPRVRATAAGMHVDVGGEAFDYVGERVELPVELRDPQGDVTHVEIAERGTEVSLDVDGKRYRLIAEAAPVQSEPSRGKSEEGDITAPMPGRVVAVPVAIGAHVDAMQPLLVLEAMKMEHVVQAPRAGIVAEILCAEGDMVAGGATLVRLRSE